MYGSFASLDAAPIFMAEMPLSALVSFGRMTAEQLDAMLETLNS